MTTTEQYVLVTTKHRGVFCGLILERESDRKITLAEARMVVFWEQATKGVLGLASAGPTDGCRITGAVPRLDLVDVTAVIYCTDEARQKLESAPWG